MVEIGANVLFCLSSRGWTWTRSGLDIVQAGPPALAYEGPGWKHFCGAPFMTTTKIKRKANENVVNQRKRNFYKRW